MNVQPDPLEGTGGIGGCGVQYHGLDGSGAALLLLEHNYASGTGYEKDTSPLRITLTLENLMESPYTDREELLIEGTWIFNFSLDRSTLPEVIALPDTEVMAMDSERQELVPVTLTNIELTSTGLRFRYDYADGTLSIEAHISVVLDNGVTIRDSGGAGTPLGDGKTLNCSHQWPVPINLDEVSSVLIGEAAIQIPA